jgi:16S rRNA (guanine527-N7)-methyltransferase
LFEANEKFNLTAVKGRDEAWTRHILDSLTLLPLLTSLEAATVADVGSGAGLPGIPLAISLPGVKFTLIEATGKKARFIEETASALGLTNVVVVNDRAEKLGHDFAHRERYDVVIARALGKLSAMLEWTVPLAKVGGFVLAMKGAKAGEELLEAKKEMHQLHVRPGEIVTTPTGVIVPIEKTRSTPKALPRVN